MKPQALIVDTAHLAYRHTAAPGEALYTKKGNMPTKAIYGIINSLNKILNSNPGVKKVYLCFEGHSKFRYDLYPEYKANREHNPESPQYKAFVAKDKHGWSRKDTLRWTINKIKEIAPKLGLHVVYNEILEGDDCAFALAKQLFGKEDLIFMTDDKDWQQLIYLFPGSKVYRAMAGEIISQQNFYETQGIPSNWFVQKKALTGDPSDNIKPVVRGAGEKSIQHLINKAIQYGIDPDSPRFFMEIRALIRGMLETGEVGIFKRHLSGFLEPEAEKNYILNIKLVDFRYCPMPLLLSESIYKPLHMDFDEAMGILQELEFDSLFKILKPGSPWFKLQ